MKIFLQLARFQCDQEVEKWRDSQNDEGDSDAVNSELF